LLLAVSPLGFHTVENFQRVNFRKCSKRESEKGEEEGLEGRKGQVKVETNGRAKSPFSRSHTRNGSVFAPHFPWLACIASYSDVMA